MVSKSNSAVKQVEQTAQQAANAIDERKANANALSNLVVKGNSSGNLVGTFKLTEDKRAPAVLDAYPPQGQKLAKAVYDYYEPTSGYFVIDADAVPVIEEACIHTSTTNEVVGVYWSLLLGKDWKKRGSQRLRDAMEGNSFALFTRVS